MNSQIKIGDEFTIEASDRPYQVIGRLRFAGKIRFVCQRRGDNYQLFLTEADIQRYQLRALAACIIY